MYVNSAQNSVLAYKDHSGWNVHSFCLERYKNLTRKEKISTGTLVESEWIFVFERIAALARKKSKTEGEEVPFTPDAVAGCVLDLRYIFHLVHVILNRYYFQILNALPLYETSADCIGSLIFSRSQMDDNGMDALTHSMNSLKFLVYLNLRSQGFSARK
jgi:hypothetical protein